MDAFFVFIINQDSLLVVWCRVVWWVCMDTPSCTLMLEAQVTLKSTGLCGIKSQKTVCL